MEQKIRIFKSKKNHFSYLEANLLLPWAGRRIGFDEIGERTQSYGFNLTTSCFLYRETSHWALTVQVLGLGLQVIRQDGS